MQIQILNGIYADNTPELRTSYPVNMVPVPGIFLGALARRLGRRRVARTLMDYLRRELAIKVDYLDPLRQAWAFECENGPVRQGQWCAHGMVFRRPVPGRDGGDARTDCGVASAGPDCSATLPTGSSPPARIRRLQPRARAPR